MLCQDLSSIEIVMKCSCSHHRCHCEIKDSLRQVKEAVSSSLKLYSGIVPASNVSFVQDFSEMAVNWTVVHLYMYLSKTALKSRTVWDSLHKQISFYAFFNNSFVSCFQWSFTAALSVNCFSFTNSLFSLSSSTEDVLIKRTLTMFKLKKQKETKLVFLHWTLESSSKIQTESDSCSQNISSSSWSSELSIHNESLLFVAAISSSLSEDSDSMKQITKMSSSSSSSFSSSSSLTLCLWQSSSLSAPLSASLRSSFASEECALSALMNSLVNERDATSDPYCCVSIMFKVDCRQLKMFNDSADLLNLY